MTDKEKGNAIDWLNDIATSPAEEWQMFYSWSETKTNAINALTLLKEQEPKQVNDIAQQISCFSGICPSCGKMLNTTCNKNFCGKCGQAVKWQ
jgi:succinate dehydrogenase/fumarate reductase-like Fe-S protein